MQLDRRVMLAGLASSGAVLLLSKRAQASFEAEYFAAARKDDRGIYSAALFNLEGGDLRAVELPGRGHDITLKPGWQRVGRVRAPARQVRSRGAGGLASADLVCRQA